MATTKVSTVLKNAQTILLDRTGTRWPLQELLGWLNMGQLAIVNHRPDALSESKVFNCALGTHQVLPAEALRLIDVVRNEGTSKRPVRKIDRNVLDDQHVDWHDDTNPAQAVDHFTYDDRNPKSFYLYPAPAVNVPIRVVYSVAPPAIVINDFETDATTISIDDTYANPLMDFVLFRAYSKDSTYAGNAERAMMALQSFNSALGIKTQVDQAMSPNNT